MFTTFKQHRISRQAARGDISLVDPAEILAKDIAVSDLHLQAADFRARYPDGRMGSDPGLATPEKGGELVALAAKGLAEEVAAFGGEERVV